MASAAPEKHLTTKEMMAARAKLISDAAAAGIVRCAPHLHSYFFDAATAGLETDAEVLRLRDQLGAFEDRRADARTAIAKKGGKVDASAEIFHVSPAEALVVKALAEARERVRLHSAAAVTSAPAAGGAGGGAEKVEWMCYLCDRINPTPEAIACRAEACDVEICADCHGRYGAFAACAAVGHAGLLAMASVGECKDVVGGDEKRFVCTGCSIPHRGVVYHCTSCEAPNGHSVLYCEACFTADVAPVILARMPRCRGDNHDLTVVRSAEEYAEECGNASCSCNACGQDIAEGDAVFSCARCRGEDAKGFDMCETCAEKEIALQKERAGLEGVGGGEAGKGAAAAGAGAAAKGGKP